MPSWVRSSRIASVGPLRALRDGYRFVDTTLETYDAANRVLGAAAEVEAFIANVQSLTSARFLVAEGARVAVSDLIGGLLTDSAYILAHNNLGAVLETFGLLPYIRDAEARYESFSDPVPSQFRVEGEFFGTQVPTQFIGLGSTVLDGLTRPATFDSFQNWVDDVLFAFDDTGDYDRPIYGPDEELACLLITVESQDPEELFDKFNSVLQIFQNPRRPKIPFKFSFDTDNEIKQAIHHQLMPTIDIIRPQLSPELFNTEPDWARVSTRDFLPIVGDLAIDLAGITAGYAIPSPNVSGVQEFATAVANQIGRLQENISRVTSLLQTTINALDTTGASRLWIPLQSGGVEGIKASIEAANSTRKDLQRVVNPASTTFQEGDTLPFNEALTIKQTIDPGFQTRPVENLIIAGVAIVLHPGALYDLVQSLFEPTSDDIAEDEGGPAVYETAGGVLDTTLANPTAFPGSPLPPDGIDGGAAEVGDPLVPTPPSPTESSNQTPNEGGVGGGVVNDRQRRGRADQAAILASSRGNLPGVSYSAERRALSVTAPGSADSAARKVSPAPSERASVQRVRALDLPTFPAQLTHLPLTNEITRVIPNIGERVPIGGITSDFSLRPDSSLSGTSWSPGGWIAPPEIPGYDNATSIPVSISLQLGGGTITSADLDAVLSALGVPAVGAGSITALLSLPWWLDVQVTWIEEGTTRTSTVRTQLAAYSATPRRYSVFPYLPYYPRIEEEVSYTAFLVIGNDPMYAMRAEDAGASSVIAAMQEAPGTTFESIAGPRRYDETVLRSFTRQRRMSLFAYCMGVILDGDTSITGGADHLNLLATTDDVGIPTSVIDEPETLLEGSAMFPVSVSGISVQQLLSPADDSTPLEMAPSGEKRHLNLREPEMYIPAYLPLADEEQANQVSDRWLNLPAEYEALLARVPRRFRVGLGRVGDGSVGLPIPSATWVGVISFDGSNWVPYDLSVLDAADLAVNSVTPTPAFEAAHAAEPWMLLAEYDLTDSARVPNAIFVPFTRREGLEAGEELWGPYDRISFAGQEPVAARHGVSRLGETGAFGGLSPTSETWMELDAPLIKDVSRRPETARGRAISLTMYATSSWRDLSDGHYTLIRTASHEVALINDRSALSLRVYEVDVITQELHWRMDLSISPPAGGRRYRADFEVVPADRTIRLTWSVADDELEDTETFTLLATDVLTVATADPRPFVRAIDGFAFHGGTLRIGRGRSVESSIFGFRDSAWTEQVDVFVSGVSTPITWHLGTPPMGFLSVTADVVLPAP